MTMTRSTASRRARNPASLTIGARRRPASRPSRRRCFLASRRVEPCRLVISSSALRGLRTLVTVFSGSSGPPSPSSPARRRRLRRRVVLLSPSPASSSLLSEPAPPWEPLPDLLPDLVADLLPDLLPDWFPEVPEAESVSESALSVSPLSPPPPRRRRLPPRRRRRRAPCWSSS